MPLQATSGAASYDAFGGGVAAGPANYIEDVFSTFLYTGNGSTQTITNGIDLAGKGGLVWVKNRSSAYDNVLVDSALGPTADVLFSNTTNANLGVTYISAFNSNGFSVATNVRVNESAAAMTSWTFRKQPKFFDVVTWTGDGASTRDIAHNLKDTPRVIIIKRTDTTSNWKVRFMFLGLNLLLNSTDNANTAASYAGGNASGGSLGTFTVSAYSSSVTSVNASGGTYVAYLFASDAGGFGLTGTDNVISCGSYTGNGSATGPVVSLGYEPQWLMVKNASGTGNWNIIDSMRGMTVGNTDAFLEANTADAEATADWVSPTATGFQITSTSSEVNTSSSTYIYIAIRRGPMKVPTTGTSVFSPVARTGTGSAAQITGLGFTPDALITSARNSNGYSKNFIDRLRGNRNLDTTSTGAEQDPGAGNDLTAWGMNGISVGAQANTPINASGIDTVNHIFKRAPGFFDVVCYTGDGTVSRTIPHNLGVIPELAIAKCRSSGGVDTDAWMVASSAINYMTLNNTDASLIPSSSGLSGSTSSVFDPTGCRNSYNYYPNISARTYVVYLFASCPGVSKVGSFTGTGATQVINCGFTGGARFVMIKRTDSTGDWYVWDSARGIVAGNDPYIRLNVSTAEVTSNDTIDTDSTGFVVNQVAATNVNVNAATYIFLAIA